MSPVGSSVLAFVLAGGEGRRLAPLTAQNCKPAMPFTGRHRVVDFVLSNLVNSGVVAIHLLVQYKSQALIDHIHRAWPPGGYGRRQFISIVPPQMRCGPEWFQGTADALFQNLDLLQAARPDLVAVFSADHIYRMDLRDMIRTHREAKADVTVAAVPVPLAAAPAFGILETDRTGRITRFSEKPAQPRAMPSRPDRALASMGNYLFNAEVLERELQRSHERGETDFGHHVLPRMTQSHRLVAYDFASHPVDGLADFEAPGYWRDIGTIDAYFDAHFDTLGNRPAFQLDNPRWPIHSGAGGCGPVRIEAGSIVRSSLGAGSVLNDAQLDHAVLGDGVRVEADARLDHCIVMGGCHIGRGARVRRAIVDEDNHLPAGTTIGFDTDADRRRFTVSEGGVVIVPRGTFRAS